MRFLKTSKFPGFPSFTRSEWCLSAERTARFRRARSFNLTRSMASKSRARSYASIQISRWSLFFFVQISISKYMLYCLKKNDSNHRLDYTIFCISLCKKKKKIIRKFFFRFKKLNRYKLSNVFFFVNSRCSPSKTLLTRTTSKCCASSTCNTFRR